MSVTNASIRPLPPDVVAQIKSSISITHLSGVVLELLKNALDADASTISINVNFERGGCIVEDDGHGIPSEEFEPGGGLGKTHHTSKWGSSQELYGQRGTFLASLTSLSLLTITSHHELDSTTNTAAFHHSTPISRLIPAPPQHRLDSRAHGTRVTVHDLFGNMPVRVKHRALSFAKSDDLDREWESLKMMLTGLLLATDKIVKVVASSSDKSRKLTFRCRCRSSREWHNRGVKPDEQDVLDLEHIQTILSQAGYINPSSFGTWVTVSARTAVLSVTSAISLEPSPTKQVQFISFGIHPMPPRNNANIIYEEINRIFSLSGFGNVDDTSETVETDSTPLPGSEKKQQDGNATAKRKTRGGTKGANRWPMFYIRISARDKGTKRIFDDSMPESDRSLKIVLDVIGTMMHNFLEQHHFRPRARKRVRWSKTDSQSPASAHREPRETVSPKRKRSSPGDLPQRSKPLKTTESFLDDNTRLPSFGGAPSHHPTGEFGSWSRVKTGTRSSLEEIFSGLPRGKGSSRAEPSCKILRGATKDDSPNEGDNSDLPPSSNTRERTRSSSVSTAAVGTSLSGEPSGTVVDKAISWTDPFKTAILLNSRTGQVIQPMERVSARSSVIPQRPRSTGSVHKSSNPIRRLGQKPVEGSMSDSWIDNILRKWENPIFRQSEELIPSVFINATNMFPPDQNSCDIKLPPSARYKGKLTKSKLEHAQVIAQVDNKFVLVRMDTTSENDENEKSPEQILVLIDQHAADERCRIEKLFQDLFEPSPTAQSGTTTTAKVQTTVLAKPLVFRVSSQEARLFESYMKFFAAWGCLYKLSTSTQKTQTIAVTSLPTLISERCRLEPKLAIDMLRGEIWAREEGTRTIPKSSTSTSLGNVSLPTNLAAEGTTGGKEDGTSWLARITHCPQGIIDMLNSRSCRSAIMFNDVLSLDECKELVTRLSRCAFPFQCAHGRPSMVPIVNLGYHDAAGDLTLDKELSTSGAWELSHTEEGSSGLPRDFGQAFRDWQGL